MEEISKAIKKSFWDRLESKQFVINLIGLMASIFFLVCLILVIIFSRNNLDRIFNLLYLLAGFILGVFGRASIKDVQS